MLKKHYANRPYSNDVNTVEGTLDIQCKGPLKLFSGLLWHMGTVPPINEKGVNVSVNFESDKLSKRFHFRRLFNFKHRSPYQFNSAMLHTQGNEVIEIMKLGLCWRSRYEWDGEHIHLRHNGYALRLFGKLIPLPLGFLLGEGNAQETAIDDQHFKMRVDIRHPIWGKIYEYKGTFKILDKPEEIK